MWIEWLMNLDGRVDGGDNLKMHTVVDGISIVNDNAQIKRWSTQLDRGTHIVEVYGVVQNDEEMTWEFKA